MQQQGSRRVTLICVPGTLVHLKHHSSTDDRPQHECDAALRTGHRCNRRQLSICNTSEQPSPNTTRHDGKARHRRKHTCSALFLLDSSSCDNAVTCLRASSRAASICFTRASAVSSLAAYSAFTVLTWGAGEGGQWGGCQGEAVGGREGWNQGGQSESNELVR